MITGSSISPSTLGEHTHSHHDRIFRWVLVGVIGSIVLISIIIAIISICQSCVQAWKDRGGPEARSEGVSKNPFRRQARNVDVEAARRNSSSSSLWTTPSKCHFGSASSNAAAIAAAYYEAPPTVPAPAILVQPPPTPVEGASPLPPPTYEMSNLDSRLHQGLPGLVPSHVGEDRERDGRTL